MLAVVTEEVEVERTEFATCIFYDLNRLVAFTW